MLGIHPRSTCALLRRCAHVAVFTALVSAVSFGTVSVSRAAPVNFVLDNTQSKLTAAFDVTALGGVLTASAQKAGSLTSRYNGTMSTLVGNIGLGGTNLTFLPGTDGDGTALSGIAPNVGGGTGTAAADYGVQLVAPLAVVIPPIDLSGIGLGTLNLGTLQSITANIALRNVLVDVSTSSSIPLNPIPVGTFNAADVDLTFSGTADINAALVLKAPDIGAYLINLALFNALDTGLAGTGIDLTVTGNLFTQEIAIGIPFALPFSGTVGNQVGTGAFQHVGAEYVMTLPISLGVLQGAGLPSIIGIDATLMGQFVGRAPYTLVPEPSSYALFAVGALGMMAFRRRQRALR